MNLFSKITVLNKICASKKDISIVSIEKYSSIFFSTMSVQQCVCHCGLCYRFSSSVLEHHGRGGELLGDGFGIRRPKVLLLIPTQQL